MNTLMILSDNIFPPDIRVKKETKALINAGHKIFLIARRADNQIKKETVDRVHVYRINYPLQTIPLIGGFLYFFIYRYFLVFYIMRMSKKYRVDALHVHDLPFALATCIAGKIIRKTVVFDMHEDYVEMMSWGMKGKKGAKKTLSALRSKILEIEERMCIALATKILVVVEEEIKRLTAMGVPSDKIEVISNTADLEELNNINVPNSYAEFNNKFVISYIGGFSKHRGLDTLVKAMPLILDKMSNAHLLLVGEGVMKEPLLRLSKYLNIEENVTFTGWVPFEEAMSYIKISDICTIPYHKTRQTNKSFPHKLSQYMYLEKPILVSDVESLRRIIEETQCGIIFEAGNPNDLAEKIIKAKKKQGFLEELGMNGKIAAEKKYNWGMTSEKLVRLYGELGSETGYTNYSKPSNTHPKLKKSNFHNQEEVWGRYINKLDELNEERIEKTISLIPENAHSIIEIGCGSGAIINTLSSFDCVVGLDSSQVALKYVSQNKVLGSCDSLPFRHKSFDIVIAAELLEHLDSQTLRKSVTELEKVSRRYILISVPYKEKPWETFVKCANCGTVYSPYNHQQYFDEYKLKHLIKSRQQRVKFCGTKKRLPSIKRIMQKFGIYSYRENSICPICGSKKLKYGKIEKITSSVLGHLTNIFAKSEPNWILCLYQLEEGVEGHGNDKA